MRRPVVSQAESLSIPIYEHGFPSTSCRCRHPNLLADKSADWFAVAFARDREAFCCTDPTPRPAISMQVCRMKPQLQPRSIHVLRHAHHFCVARASSQVFSLTARAVPMGSSHNNPTPSPTQPLLRPTTPACHTSRLNPAPIKSHSQGLPSSRCIESARTLQ